jgi:hypothetical protein
VAADVLARHDVAAATRAEIAGQPVEETIRGLGPVGGAAFSQQSGNPRPPGEAVAVVTSFVFNNVSGSELAVSQTSASRVGVGITAAASSDAESVVEWVVPNLAANEAILWKYSVAESAAPGPGSSASAQANTSFQVENLTQGTTLVSGGAAPLTVQTLEAASGHVVRLRLDAATSSGAAPGDGGASARAAANNRFRIVDTSQLVAPDVFGPIRAAVVEDGGSGSHSLLPNSPPPAGVAAFSAQVGQTTSDVRFGFATAADHASIEMDVDLLFDPQRANDLSLGEFSASIVPIQDVILSATLRLDVSIAAGTFAEIGLELADVDTGETLLVGGSSSDAAAAPFEGTLTDEASIPLVRGHLYSIRGSALLLSETAPGAGDLPGSATGRIAIAIVPEPGAGVLTALGLLAVAWARGRRRSTCIASIAMIRRCTSRGERTMRDGRRGRLLSATSPLILLLALSSGARAGGSSDSVDVIVQCRRPYAALVSRIEAMGGRVTRSYENVGGLAVRIPGDELGRLRAEAGVEAVERDFVVHLPRQREDHLGVFPFEVDAAKVAGGEELQELGIDPANYASYLSAFTGAEDVWTETDLGAGSLVAVIDSGTYADHVCLSGRVIAGPDFSTDAGTPFEGSTRAGNFYHGTFVAGQVASSCAFEIAEGSGFDAHLPPEARIPVRPGVFSVPMLGIAPSSEIYAVKIFSHTGASVASSIINAALDHVITLKRSGTLDVDVINMSFGGVTLHDGRTLQERLVDEATRAGIVVAVSAGNDGPSPATVSRPGTAFSAVTVGAATDPVHTRIFLDEFYGFVGAGAVLYPADELRIMEFSGQGPYADGRPGPDLVATGLFNFGLFPPPGPPFIWSSGTSFAAPQVAGGAALLNAWAEDHDPSLGAWEIRRALIDGAVPLGQEWSVQSQGSGFLNLPNALAILRDPGRGRGAPGAERARFASAHGRLQPNVRFEASDAFHDRVTLERGRWVDWVFEIDGRTDAVVIELEPVGGAIPPGPSGLLGFPESFELFVKSAKRGGVEPDIVDAANVFDAARVEVRAGATLLQGGISGNLVRFPPALLEPGLMKVTLESDWTNNTRFLGADVTITRVQGPKPGRPRGTTAVVRQSEAQSFPIEVPSATARATFDLSWRRDWRRFPTDDLDLIVVPPSGARDFRGATLNAPEQVVFDEPEPGTWIAIVDGFTVHRERAPFVLQVTLEPPGGGQPLAPRPGQPRTAGRPARDRSALR